MSEARILITGNGRCVVLGASTLVVVVRLVAALRRLG